MRTVRNVDLRQERSGAGIKRAGGASYGAGHRLHELSSHAHLHRHAGLHAWSVGLRDINEHPQCINLCDLEKSVCAAGKARGSHSGVVDRTARRDQCTGIEVPLYYRAGEWGDNPLE